jgi:tetratricopeptide (TPR) repeat protein
VTRRTAWQAFARFGPWWAVLWLAAALLVAAPGRTQEAPSELELQQKADAALSRNDWRGAIPELEVLITKFPASKNEQPFWDLTKLCDVYGLDHEKAITYYRLYAERFPGGRFSVRFKERLAYLESHRQDWGALRELAAIQADFHKRPTAESLVAAEKLASTPLSPSAAAEVCGWLASQFLKTGELDKARLYAERHVATFPDNGKGRTAHVQALQVSSKIAARQRQYGAAIVRLEQIEAVDPSQAGKLASELRDLHFHRGAQRVFYACAGYIVLALAGVAASRPWRRKRFGLQPGLTAALCAAVVSLSAVPGALLVWRGERVPPTFWVLAAAGCSIVVVLQLGTAALARTGRVMWAVLGVIFAAAMIYSSFYVTNTAKVLDWQSSARRD